ncbi:hypothetical protein PIROE2DRAFT_7809 [Piromyces sp. E2]|nr:hypothetical protein PIROE2DRAFT_7809 [Piromyces sp. E2]|eukprot:OUM65186.1 hypothetical protein PIROE2DRAFT_7809 [Piromyces sp. E2]
MNEIENKSPVSILLAHLYYKHNDTNEGTFEDIINECCSYIDYTLFPNCTDNNKIKISLGECDEKNQNVPITYINCNPGTDDDLYPKVINCPYIPYKYYKGIGIIIIIDIALTLCYLSMIIKMENENQYFIIAILTVITSLVIVILFAGSKLFIVFNINFMNSETSPVLLVVSSEESRRRNSFAVAQNS